MKNTEPEKRAARRRLVGLPVECKRAGRVADGLVRDITLAGAFIAPTRGRGPSGLRVSSKAPLDRLLQVGDQFLLTYIQTTVMNKRSTLATVSWEGMSSEHGLHGYGVRYDTTKMT